MQQCDSLRRSQELVDFMPIKKELRRLYPANWRELSAGIKFGRALGRCEDCGRPHGATFLRGGKVRKVILATAHLDHNPANNDDGNLRALCAACHLRHDRKEHQRRRRITLRGRKADTDFFEAANA
jgi:hypothetical protein